MPDTTRPFDHIVIIMFENQYRGYVMDNPYFKKLAGQGMSLANSFGVMHPSQTNYITSIAGELCGVTGDDPPASLLPQKTIVDLVEAAGLEWKAYMDSYVPGLSPWSPELVPADQYPYVIKHDPFSSFERIVRNEARWQRVVSVDQFWVDVQQGTLPHYAWITPDMWNDGHYTRGLQSGPHERAPALVDQSAAWLEWFFGTINFPGSDSLLPPRTMVVVTWDEADFEADWDAGKKYTYDGPNQIYTVLLGDGIEAGGVEEEGHNHYSLLKTVEKNFGLGSLEKNDQDANWLRFLWGERFRWGEAAATPISAPGALAAAGLDGRLYAVYANAAGQLQWRGGDGVTWSQEASVGQSGHGNLALAAFGESLVLVFQDEGGGLSTVTYRPSSGWSATKTVLVPDAVEALALATFDRGDSLMLAYRGADGAIATRRFRDGAWEAGVDTGMISHGSIALCALGGCLLMVFQDADGPGLTAVTYNTAPYNVLELAVDKYSGPYDDTTLDAWSPSSFPVAHFAAAAQPTTPGVTEPLLEPFTAAAPLAMAELDGVVHLLHPPVAGSGLVTETFSIAGLLTPKLPVTYRKSDATTTSNGYGTLAEAGWSLQASIDGLEPAANGTLAMARVGDQIGLLFRSGDDGGVALCLGRYEADSATGS